MDSDDMDFEMESIHAVQEGQKVGVKLRKVEKRGFGQRSVFWEFVLEETGKQE